MPLSPHSLTRRRFIGAAATLSSATLLLTACGGSGATSAPSAGGWTVPSADPTATINVLSHLSLKNDKMQDVVDAFEKAHPTIKVNFETVPFDSLASTIDALQPDAQRQAAAGDFAASLTTLAGAREAVDAFFNDVMVMAEDPAVRRNRLALLARLHGLMNQVADLGRLA